MALYLVVHTPRAAADEERTVRPPTRLLELAQASLAEDASPRWLRTWSPDLHDDRLFSLWESDSAAAIEGALARFGFLDDMEAQPIRVRQWGPDEVLAASP